jgi:hypothetical protein
VLESEMLKLDLVLQEVVTAFDLLPAFLLSRLVGLGSGRVAAAAVVGPTAMLVARFVRIKAARDELRAGFRTSVAANNSYTPRAL